MVCPHDDVPGRMRVHAVRGARSGVRRAGDADRAAARRPAGTPARAPEHAGRSRGAARRALGRRRSDRPGALADERLQAAQDARRPRPPDVRHGRVPAAGRARGAGRGPVRRARRRGCDRSGPCPARGAAAKGGRAVARAAVPGPRPRRTRRTRATPRRAPLYGAGGPVRGRTRVRTPPRHPCRALRPGRPAPAAGAAAGPADGRPAPL